MARRRNFRGRGGGGTRRRLFWARRAETVVLTSGNRAFSHNLLAPFEAAYGADLFGFTVTRIVGSLTFYSTEQTSVRTAFQLSAGIRLDEQSQALGATEAEEVARMPFNDPFADWMWARNRPGVTPNVGDTQQPVLQLPLNLVELDLRSQRRLDELGRSLFLFAGLVTHPGSDITMDYDLHILCKRP